MNRFKSITFDERSWTIEYDKLKKGYFIFLDSFLDIQNLVESELNYKKIVDEQLEALAERININGEKVLLSSFKKKDW